VALYLPIAEMSVNIFVLLGMGAAVGFLSGMFGVGGGFLITPLLIFYNIPPAVAVATGANQVVASSVSGVLSHFKRGTVDIKLGVVLLIGGIAGSTVGVWLFSILRDLGQLDLIVSILYVGFLGTVGGLMMAESLRALARSRSGATVSLRRRAPIHGCTSCPSNALQGLQALCQRDSGARPRPDDRRPRLDHGRRRRLHHGSGDDLSAQGADQCRHRHLAVPDHLRRRLHHGRACDDEPDRRCRARIAADARFRRRRAIWRQGRVSACAANSCARFSPASSCWWRCASATRCSWCRTRSIPFRGICCSEVCCCAPFRPAVRAARCGAGHAGRGRGNVNVAEPSLPERIEIGLSTETIAITSDFSGVDLTIFGAIDNIDPLVQRQGRYDVFVVLEGPSVDLVTRRKARVLGIWMNVDSQAVYRACPNPS
jgi:hypothetical protein